MSVLHEEAVTRIANIANALSSPASEPIPWAARIQRAAAGTLRDPVIGDRAAAADARRIERDETILGHRGDPHSFVVPTHELGVGTRALTVGASTAGNLVDQKNWLYAQFPQPATAFLDFAQPYVVPHGVGPIAVPVGEGSLAPTMLASELTAVADSTVTVGQASASPKRGVATVTFSRLLQLQSSPDINGVLNLELRNAARTLVAAQLLGGTGVNGAVKGVFGSTNVPTASGASASWATVVAAQEAVAASNGIFDLSRTAWVAPPATAGVLMQRFSTPRIVPLWEDNLNAGSIGDINAYASSAAPASTLLYGDFSTVLLVLWGGAIISVDPFQGSQGSNFKQGLISMRIELTFDVVLRYPISFYTLTAVS